MGFPERLRAVYDAYLDKVEELERNRKPGDGLFGLRPGPADHPCHDRFGEELAALLKEYAGTAPPSSELRQMLEEIYLAAKKYPEPQSSYWMLIAVHGLTEEMIGLLSSEDAGGLLARYEKIWPRRERLPVQTRIVKKLRQAAKAG